MPEYLVPLAVVMLALLVVPRKALNGSSMRPSHAVALLVALGAITLRYLYWRVTETLPGPESSTGETVFAWTLFVIEMMVLFDTTILFSTLVRRRDNSPAADEGEARLRASDPAELPTVDVFIATYNEGLDVLEKTIIGALAIDWPADKLRVCVLDDGKRDWLREFCERKGADYFTRPDNAHAKAGNINAAIARTDGEFFMVLDADFIPQRHFLYRAIGLFEDPKVGIVQAPHCFYNSDPMQSNLDMRHRMPDDQRLFFGSIMPGRDGWDTAFCCGSNSITRRTAIEAVGGGLPTGSITEDMLLTMVMLRKGYVTRYLNERLAIGLAPESLSAMYVQRARWARGAIQILFLREGPFGPGLKLYQRLMFLPLHWMIQPLMVIATLTVPAICLWTGWAPLPATRVVELVEFQIPVLLATLGTLRLIAPNAFFPLAATVHAAIQAPRILPTVVTTLIRPHGHAFKVTPKGRDAGGRAVDHIMIMLPAVLIFLTALGFATNASFNSRIITSFEQLPILAFWACASVLVLLCVQVVAVSPEAPNRDERFRLLQKCRIGARPGKLVPARIDWLSLSDARIKALDMDEIGFNKRWLRLEIPGVGPVAARITGQRGDRLWVSFDLGEGARRDALVALLFTSGYENSPPTKSAFKVSLSMLGRILTKGGGALRGGETGKAGTPPPAWLQAAGE
ncbi:glycosyltransferase [Salipiger abyssi]|uniref:Cellulose synthase (UDP-forming) n=1 Tax=Salipiger abyssi TaxID=1250539 RepID=A0A1P8USH9_9RHOB|nr:glycosyltransferase [Salipiger abyssi]APZ52363.1 cellulose synthase (UDP-forming) [Salipiger abyssi]